MDIRGKFFAAGHGLTYGLKAGDLNVLFDIKRYGGDSYLKDIKAFFGSKIIDILVLSHLHADHTDGVRALFANGFYIRSIYIPYVDEDEKFILRLMRHIKAGRGGAAILGAVPGEDGDMLGLGQFDVQIIEVRDPATFAAPSAAGKDLWTFDLYQSRGNTAWKKTIDKILKKLAHLGIHTKADVLANIYDHFDEIKAAYEYATKDLNLTSLFMVHGPADPASVRSTSFKGKPFIPSIVSNPPPAGKYHSLISGDCNLSNNSAVLTPYIPRLGYALVPHHSGVKEWDDLICTGNNDVVWVVTIKKVSSRPYGKVVSDIYSNHSSLYICDQTDCFDHSFVV